MVLFGVSPNLLEACCCRTEVLSGDLGERLIFFFSTLLVKSPSVDADSILFVISSTMDCEDKVNFFKGSPLSLDSFAVKALLAINSAEIVQYS